MTTRETPLPSDSLLARYATRADCYTDCFQRNVPTQTTLADLIQAFYSTRLFSAERAILTLATGKRITQSHLDALANGSVSTFAVWQVEDRIDTQILLADKSGHTRSWLMTQPNTDGTDLYFGSAVVPYSRVTKALTPLHKLYSKALLKSVRI